MPDVVPIKLRSRIMSRIRAKNTQIELEIRRRLFVRGFRYRIHRMDLPGTRYRVSEIQNRNIRTWMLGTTMDATYLLYPRHVDLGG